MLQHLEHNQVEVSSSDFETPCQLSIVLEFWEWITDAILRGALDPVYRSRSYEVNTAFAVRHCKSTIEDLAEEIIVVFFWWITDFPHLAKHWLNTKCVCCQESDAYQKANFKTRTHVWSHPQGSFMTSHNTIKRLMTFCSSLIDDPLTK